MSKRDPLSLVRPRGSRWKNALLFVAGFLAVQLTLASVIFGQVIESTVNGHPLGAGFGFVTWVAANVMTLFGWTLHWIVAHD
jgi:hypothetical protein